LPIVNGAVNAKAQGHATIRMAVKTLNAVATSIKTQYRKDTTDSKSNAGVK
jgi:hypothetical protein